MVYVIFAAALGLPTGFLIGWLMGWHEHEQRHNDDVREIARLRHVIRTLGHEPPTLEGPKAPGTSR